MKTIYTKKPKSEFEKVTKEIFEELTKGKSFTFIENIEADCRYTKNYSSYDFNSCVKDSLEKFNMLIVSSVFHEKNKFCYGIFDPFKNEYIIKKTWDEKTPVNVTEEKYLKCLEEISAQKKEDALYSWKPSKKDYYEIENWVFSVNENDLV